MRNVIVGAQMLTMIALAIYFWRDGLTRLSMAQFCYCVATGFLFIGVK